MGINEGHDTEPIERTKLVLDDGTHTLNYDGHKVSLRPKTFNVLKVFISNPNKIISKEEMIKEVWSNTVISDDCLTQCIVEIRKALRDDGHLVIKTYPKRGYTFDPSKLQYPSTAQKRHYRLYILTASLIATIFFAVLMWSYNGNVNNQIATVTHDKSIAVIPFTKQPDSGIETETTELITNEVIRLISEYTELQVISNNAYELLNNTSGNEAAVLKKLKASHILTGSFTQRDNQLLRVTVQLVETDGFKVVWSKSYHDILKEINLLPFYIVHSLTEHFENSHALSDKKTYQAQAVNHYLEGMRLFNTRGEQNLASAEQHFKQAIEIENDYVDAIAGLASVYYIQSKSGKEVNRELLSKAHTFAKQALSYDPNHPVANIRMADSLYSSENLGLDYQRNSFEKALIYAPDHPLVLGKLMGSYLINGETRKALATSKKLVQLQPDSIVARANLGHAYFLSGMNEQAIKEFRIVADSSSEFRPELLMEIAKILIIEKRETEARQLIEGMEPSEHRSLLIQALSREKAESLDLDNCSTRQALAKCIAVAEMYSYFEMSDEVDYILAILEEKLSLGRSFPGCFNIIISFRNSPLLKENDYVKGLLSNLKA